MKNIKNSWLLLFCLCVFLISCRATRQEVQKSATIEILTTSDIVSYKDTILHTPKSETSIKIPLSETVIKPGLNGDLKPKVFSQKNGNAKVKIKIVHDTITADCDCDSLAIMAKIKYQIKKENQKSEVNKSDETHTKTGYTLFQLIVAFIVGFGVCYLLKFFKVV